MSFTLSLSSKDIPLSKNPYLKRLQEKYDALRADISGVQSRAAEADRDLTEDELRTVTEQSAEAKKLYAQIEDATEVEARNLAVEALAAKLPKVTESAPAPEAAPQTRAVSNTSAVDRDPGHYRKNAGYSYFGDMYRAKTQDDAAATQRLTEHTRALTTGTNGPGVVPPHWMVEEFELLARQNRSAANAVRNIPLGNDPRPITLPKQIAGTDNVVVQQATEGTSITTTDVWNSSVDVVSPKPTAGKQIVSRQLLDMSQPSIDLLIYGDLMAVYNYKVEAQVCAALLAAATAGATAIANEAAFNNTAASGNAIDAVIDAQTSVYSSRFMPADHLICSIPRFGKFRKLKDSTGRPIMPMRDYNPLNAAGLTASVQAGELEGLSVLPTAGIGAGTAYPEVFLVIRGQDTVLFESNVMQFRFEEQVGPESIVLGIWGYTGVIVRQGGRSTKSVTVTAAV